MPESAKRSARPRFRVCGPEPWMNTTAARIGWPSGNTSDPDRLTPRLANVIGSVAGYADTLASRHTIHPQRRLAISGLLRGMSRRAAPGFEYRLYLQDPGGRAGARTCCIPPDSGPYWRAGSRSEELQ